MHERCAATYFRQARCRRRAAREPLREFRRLLRTLQHRNDDPRRSTRCSSSDEFLRVDPRVAGDYLAHFRAEHIRRHVAALLDSDVQNAAVELHLLRVLKGGTPVARPLMERARSTGGHPAIRAQALFSMPHNDRSAHCVAMDVADDPSAGFWERRAAIAYLARVDGRARNRLLSKVVSESSSLLGLTARWARGQAA